MMRLLLAAIMAAACVRPQPYVPLFALSSADTALGRTGCDLNDQPYMEVSDTLSPLRRWWVIDHERVHVTQIRRSRGGCRAFSVRYLSDPSFRLAMEAEAFCVVHVAQVRAGQVADPDLEGIAWRLRHRYDWPYSELEVHQAMPCYPKDPP